MAGEKVDRFLAQGRHPASGNVPPPMESRTRILNRLEKAFEVAPGFSLQHDAFAARELEELAEFIYRWKNLYNRGGT